MHSAGRNALSYRKAWIAAADRSNVLLVVPEFGKDQFPKSWDYEQGGLYRRLVANMKLRIDWTISIVDRPIDDVFRRLAELPRPIYLYGHSGGGQFVHRYMMFGRAGRIVRAVAANSGWYMMPSSDTRFPLGLLGTPHDSAVLRNYLATPMIVFSGVAETRITKSPRQSKRAMQQGAHRLARGRTFFDAGRRLAAILQVPFGWQFETVPGIGHSNRKRAPAAAKISFR